MTQLTINNKNEARALMALAMNAARVLIQNGAEIYRAQDTAQRICESRGNIYDVNVFAISNAIFISLEYNDEIITMFKDIGSNAINLDKIDKVNSFSRRFVSEKMRLSEARLELRKIRTVEPYPIQIKVLFAGVASAVFALMIQGTIKDFFATLFIGMVVYFTLDYISKYNVSFFIESFIGAFMTSAMALILVMNGFGDNLDEIIIGAIMILVPGVAITNAVRDLMSGEFLAGLINFVKAMFIALAIALGVGLVLNYKYLGGY